MFKTETYLKNGNTLEYIKLNDLIYAYNILDEDDNSIKIGFCTKKEILDLEKCNDIKETKNKFLFIKKEGYEKLLYDPSFSRFDLYPELTYSPKDFIMADDNLYKLLLNCRFFVQKGKQKELFENNGSIPTPEAILFSQVDNITNEGYNLQTIIQQCNKRVEVKIIPDPISNKIIRTNQDGKEYIEFFYKPTKNHWEYIYLNFLKEKKLQVHQSPEAKKYILDHILGLKKN